jgi:uncharacterized protein YdcH (DUF465 family)
MNKFFLCKVLIYLFFLVPIRLFSMPGSDTTAAQPDASAQPAGMPAQPDASAQPMGMPAQPDAYAQPVGMPVQPDTSAQPMGMPAQPDTSAQPVGMPAQPDASAQMTGQPPAGPQPQAAPPAEEVKPEQLGEFQLSENQPEIMQDKDPNFRNLVKKSNELNKQIGAVVGKIKEIRDNVFNKFSAITSSLDEFYQKIGFESGRVHELLKEEK